MISRFLAIGSILLFGGTASAQQIQDDFQIQGDFDKEWVTDTKGNGALSGYDNTYLRPGTQPLGWEASNVHQKVGMEVKETLVTPDVDREGHPNGHSVLLTNKEVGALNMTSPAPAYITLGVPWVYAIASVDKCDGGTLGGITFSKRPDAIRGWYKRPGNSGKSQVIVYAWKGTYTSTVNINPDGSLGLWGGTTTTSVQDQDRCIINNEGYDSKTEGAKLIAKCDESITGEAIDWKPFEFPIQYVNNEVPEKINVIISACDYWNRSNIKSGETMTVDDVKFVYWSDLRSLSYDGTPVDISDPDNIQISALMPFDKSKVVATSGHGASIEYNYDETEKILTITITGEDNSDLNPNKNEYKVKVNELIPADASEVNGTYHRWIQVYLNGGLSSESLNEVEIDGTGSNATFKLAHFDFQGQPIDNVEVPNVVLTYADEQKKVININAPQQMVNVDKLGEVPITFNGTMTVDGKVLTADLDIPVAPGFLEVKVHVGDAPFTTVEENRILKVGGEIKSASIAAFVKGESTANEIDLTDATLAEGLKTSDFSAEANNLFKIADGQTLDGNNVIKDGVCDNFVLTDGQSFNAPEDFTASQITYNRVIAPSTDKDEVYTFVLPFALTADQVNGTVYDLTDVKDGVLDFKSVANLEANHPYLVVSNGTELLNNENGELSGKISATNDLTHEISGGVAMVGAYETTSVKSEGNESWYGYNADGKFVNATTGTINPFRAAIKSTGIAPSSYALKLDGTVTGILNLENPNAKVDVYTVSGVCVRKNVPAASALNGLSRGVYIVGGQKVVK